MPAQPKRGGPARRQPAKPRGRRPLAVCLPQETERLVEFFRAISDPTRQRILVMLDGGELSASEIVRAFRLSQSTISRHLGVLRHAGLVRTRREGKRVIYSLECRNVTSCCQGFFSRMSCCAPLFRTPPRAGGGKPGGSRERRRKGS